MDDPASDDSSRSLDISSSDDVDEEESHSVGQFDEDPYWHRALPAKRNKNDFQGTDLLSNLPENVMNRILMLLPLQMAVRTSILSKKWRYKWSKLPQLTLDRSLWDSTNNQLTPSIKFRNIMYHILTLHSGPLTKFTLSISEVKKYSMLGSLMYFLSRQDIQHLVLEFSEWNAYRLPPQFFSCLQLRHLRLQNCVVCPPPAFKGFDMLVGLEICNVTISTELLESLISHSQLLEKLVLDISDPIQINAPKLRFFKFSGCIRFVSFQNVPPLAKLLLFDSRCFEEVRTIDFENFFLSLPVLECLYLDSSSNQCQFVDVAGLVPRRLPSPLNYLKRLHVFLDNFDGFYCALYLIRSSPHLQDVKMEVWLESYSGSDDSVSADKVSATFSDVTLDHLRTVQLMDIKLETHEPKLSEWTILERGLIERLLTKSPKLVKMLIVPYNDKYRGNIVAELAKIQPASREAEVVVFEDPDGVGYFSSPGIIED